MKIKKCKICKSETEDYKKINNIKYYIKSIQVER